MKINDFNKMICNAEGKKKQVSIAQVSEIIKIANELTKNKLYQIINEMEEVKNV